MTRRGLVLASYGTTRQDARRRDIEPLARDLCAAAPGTPFCEAYLSAPVRRMLRRKGVSAPGALGDALAALADAGAERACVQPALIVAGSTLDALLAEASGWEGAFPGGIAVGEPLLSSARDLRDVARAIAEAHPVRPGRALVLVGHGATGGANQPYLALLDELRAQGRADAFLGLLDGAPGVDEVIGDVAAAGLGTAALVPLMLTAGSHVARQLAAGAPDGWQAQLRAAGVEADLDMRGLGSLPAIRTVFLNHARVALRP